MISNIKHRMDIKHIQTEAYVVASVKCTQTILKQHQGQALHFIRGSSAKDGEPFDNLNMYRVINAIIGDIL